MSDSREQRPGRGENIQQPGEDAERSRLLQDTRRHFQENSHGLALIDSPSCMSFYAAVGAWLRAERERGHFRVSASGKVIPLWTENAHGQWITEQFLDSPCRNTQIRIEGDQVLMVWEVDEDHDHDARNLWRASVDGVDVPTMETEEEAKGCALAAALGQHELFDVAVEDRRAIVTPAYIQGLTDRVMSARRGRGEDTSPTGEAGRVLAPIMRWCTAAAAVLVLSLFAAGAWARSADAQRTAWEAERAVEDLAIRLRAQGFDVPSSAGDGR